MNCPFIGMSHGANVTIQAAEMLQEKHGIKVNIISVNALSYNWGPENLKKQQKETSK
jgi:hypothetical protein